MPSENTAGIADVWPPYAVLVFSVIIALSGSATFGYLLDAAAPGFTTLSATASPAGVSGADLVANLLTISALTIGVCIAYLCLPSDRLELRISTYLKVGLEAKFVKEDHFTDYFNSLDASNTTANFRVVKCLLLPLPSLGGWSGINEADMCTVFGKKQWEKLRRFVDHHVDDHWIRILVYGLSASMAFGVADLAMRYSGYLNLHFSKFEVFAIILMLSVNTFTGALLVYLLTGGHAGESTAQERIMAVLEEVVPPIKEHMKSRAADAFKGMDRETQNALARAMRRKAE